MDNKDQELVLELKRRNPSGLFRLTLLVFSVVLFFSTLAIATPPAFESKELPNPHVTFEKGVLAVFAKDVKFQTLLQEIGEKTGIDISLNDQSLKEQKVTVRLEGVAFETGLKAILQNAGIVSNALVYKSSHERGETGQFVIEEILLIGKGTSTNAPQTVVQQEKTKGKQFLEKEPFFNKKLNRFVEVVKGEVLVRFKQGATDEAISTILKGLVVLRKNQLGVYRLKIPEALSVSEFIEQRKENKEMELVEPNFIVATLAAPPPRPTTPCFLASGVSPKVG